MKMQIAEIGMPRTGTRSLAHAMRDLGYDVAHGLKGYRDMHDKILRYYLNGDARLPIYDLHEYVGNLACYHWRQLADEHPHLRFILTLRDEQSWLQSCKRRWLLVLRARKLRYLQQDAITATDLIRIMTAAKLFGSVSINDVLWVENFRRYNREVIERFNDEPQRLLTVNLSQGDGWEQLCKFLDKPVPPTPFPNTVRTLIPSGVPDDGKAAST